MHLLIKILEKANENDKITEEYYKKLEAIVDDVEPKEKNLVLKLHGFRRGWKVNMKIKVVTKTIDHLFL